MRQRCPAVLVSIALLLSACTGGTEAHGESRAGTSLPLGGTLHLAMTALVYGLDPQQAYDPQEWELFRCCLLRTLLSYNGRSTSQGGSVLHPDLATALPAVSADGLTWSFHIRSGMRYAPPLQDTAIVAGDFVRALEREATPSVSAGYPMYYSLIDGFDAYASGQADSIAGLATPDAHTLVVRLSHPSGDLAYLFAMPATAPIPVNPLRPEAPLGVAEGHDDGYGPFLVASGPYMLEGSAAFDLSAPADQQAPIEGFAPDRSITLVRNPSWSRQIDHLRPAYADRIHLALEVSAPRAARMIDRGSLDLFLDQPPDRSQVRAYRSDPSREDRVRTGEVNGTLFIRIDIAVQPFDDVHVRRALSYAIDRAALAATANTSSGLTFAPVAPASHIAPDGTEGGLLSQYDPYPYDPAAAAREMAASRYDRNHDGVCDAYACRRIRAVSLPTTFPHPGLSLLIADLARIGLDLSVREAGGSRFTAATSPGGSAALGIGDNWIADFPSASQFGSVLFGSASLPPGCCNNSLLGATPRQLRRSGYSVTSVPNVDEQIARCEAEVASSGVACWAEFDQYLMDEIVPIVPLFTPVQEFVLSGRVVRFSFDQSMYMPALDRIAVAPGSG